MNSYMAIGSNIRGANAEAGRAARREVYLTFGYNYRFIRAFGEFAKKLVETPALLTKNKVKLKDFLIKIRKYAKAYYLDVYDTLKKNLSNLESLSAKDVKSLSTKLGALKIAKSTLVSNVVQPLKNKYPIIEKYLVNPLSSSMPVNITVDEIETYWKTLSGKFNSSCDEIIRISGEIKEILGRIRIKG
ncbi:virulence associated lipoprotein [Borrelia crocidurae]|nr:virulence associated lipoprotein [Borrelia crocidurae]